ncbi:DUF2273 domain-containing protein [Enterococcus ureilyticus]|uniref:DUF2273 domain-containing protein n=1 Tax=Enterococcus ureilyticus TaxID=1131292 RepID=A0A1E5HC41_9ENTE|nr:MULTISPECIES: DUF2273 domain-containing protein [Enterococcus]MBM7690423.1 putative membrane protein [Enterococcus ureilyticus]MBO0473615.1 DUF2273 domain-containing protein [Enterococcus ureasiticus]OEG22517.1 DUF2273 domain-containing protein [Enterococcus ureilyticus]
MELVKKYKIPIVGFVIGIILAVLFIYVGFFKMIAILALGLLGSVAGYYINQRYLTK